MTTLALVIVNWNNFPDTRICLQSIFAADKRGLSLRIFVVDNGSIDDSPVSLEKEFGNQIEILRSTQNLGFAGGNNLGIRKALASSHDLILLLNNDTLVAPEFFQRLTEACAARPQVGIFGGKIFYHSSPNRLWYGGGEVQKILARARHFGFRENDGPVYQTARRVTFVTGCLMLIRRSVFERVGFFQEDLFLYFEDAEFCLRARRHGVEMRFLPEAVIWHKVGAGEGGDYASLYYYYQTRNRYIVMRKEGGWLYRVWLFMLHVLLYSAVRTMIMLMSSRRQSRSRVRALWLGCWDGLRGRTGERKSGI